VKNITFLVLVVCFSHFSCENVFAMEYDQNYQEPLLLSSNLIAGATSSMSPLIHKLASANLSLLAKNSPHKSEKRLVGKMSSVQGVYSPDSVKNSLNRRSQVNSSMRIIEGMPFRSPIILPSRSPKHLYGSKKKVLNLDDEAPVSSSLDSNKVTSLGFPQLTMKQELRKQINLFFLTSSM
jgi:hypothetical protein